MSENVETLKRGYQAFGQGDMETVMALYTDDITWEAGDPSTGLPGAGTHEGKDGVQRFFGTIPENFDQFSVNPDEWIDGGGDTVIVLGHNEATTKSGNSFKAPFVHIWRFRDGKVCRVQSLTDTALVKQNL